MASICTNCGGKVLRRVEVRDNDENLMQTIHPEGDNVGVCENCLMAVDMDEELPEGTGQEAPPPEHSPRGTPDQPRVEDSIVLEEGFEPAPTSSPEVPPEVAVSEVVPSALADGTVSEDISDTETREEYAPPE